MFAFSYLIQPLSLFRLSVPVHVFFFLLKICVKLCCKKCIIFTFILFLHNFYLFLFTYSLVLFYLYLLPKTFQIFLSAAGCVVMHHSICNVML